MSNNTFINTVSLQWERGSLTRTEEQEDQWCWGPVVDKQTLFSTDTHDGKYSNVGGGWRISLSFMKWQEMTDSTPASEKGPTRNRRHTRKYNQCVCVCISLFVCERVSKRESMCISSTVATFAIQVEVDFKQLKYWKYRVHLLTN